MNDHGIALARAALDLVGTPFALHGRDRSSGLDCVGLVGAAMETAGFNARLPSRYSLRQTSPCQFLHFAELSGLSEVTGALQAGDILLARIGPCQIHLLIAAGNNGFVHAHAGLRRTVLTPSPPPWPIIRHWRIAA